MVPHYASMISGLLRACVGAGLSGLIIGLSASGPIQAADRELELPTVVSFNRDIRPLLSDNCFACHGPDKNKREADLRLDTEEGLVGSDGHGGTVKANEPEASELWRRITSEDPDERMPPPRFGKVLSDRDRQLIRRWIEQGAKWEGHWAFLPIQRYAPPDVERDAFWRNPIDSFVLAELARQGMTHAAEADRITLLRRLRFDLTGLPPEPREVDEFLADQSPEAYEKLVDRILASPEFGERMAMWWLDLVRYADSVGYHGDQPVSVFPFRDYVIQSFNGNKPFDQFTLEQLAGDLLPEGTLEQKIASGYNRLGMMSAEGGVQPKEYLAKYIAERVRNLSGTWLGVTLGCCECHDHKYDPFTSREFYSLEAFFADIEERGLYSGAHASGAWGPNVQVPTREQAEQRARLDEEIAEVRAILATATPELAAAQTAWEAELQAEAATWITLEPHEFSAANGTELQRQPDGSLLATGASPDTETYTLHIANPPSGITALRLETLLHESLPKQGPGRAGNGNFVLTEVVVKYRGEPDGEEQTLKLQHATASYEQTGAAEKHPYKKWAAESAIDGDTKGANFGWAIMEQVGQPQQLVFETATDVPGGEQASLTIQLQQNHDNAKHTLGRFRLAATTRSRPVKASRVPANILSVLAIAAAERNDAQQTELATYYRSIAPALEPHRQQLAKLEKELTELVARIPTTLVTARVEPRTIRVLSRGNWMDDQGEIVEPAVPKILPGLAAERRLTRLDLAQWIVSPDHPLTARVFANRLWKIYFGAGLSRKLDDLGAQGEGPSHPELLDWLAVQFIDSGYDVKGLVKLIVMSGTYRQATDATAEQRERDPYNRWLSHQSRFRIDAEMVRDNALKISGLLVETVGGPSVKPYQPPGYWAYLNFPTREWQNGSGSDLFRRGLYTHWQRQYLHPALLAFDAPSREECTAERPRSNTPLQSLVLMNDPEYVEAARVFARRTILEGGETDADRLAWAYRRALSRPPAPREADVLLGLLTAHRAQYAEEQAAVDGLLAIGASPTPDQIDRVELAAWISVTRTILNLHETITRP